MKRCVVDFLFNNSFFIPFSSLMDVDISSLNGLLFKSFSIALITGICSLWDSSSKFFLKSEIFIKRIHFYIKCD